MIGRISILYIDKYDNNLLAFNAYFRPIKHYEIHLCSNTREAFQILLDFKIDVIIVDQPFPSQTGIEFLDDLPLSVKRPIKFIVSGHRDSSLAEKAKDEGAIIDFFSKPYDLGKIDQSIQNNIKNISN